MAQQLIIQKLRTRDADFVRDPDGTQSDQIKFAEAAMKAVLNGVKSKEWRDYMILNSCNNFQLRRLRGQDDFFSQDWGRQALCYISGDPICSIDSRSRADVHLTKRMIEGLSAEGSEPKFNEVDPDFPGNADPV
jgi:hypothetical protein